MAIEFQSIIDAAEKGDAEAQNKLGFAFEDGQGIDQDYHLAMKWFLAAAEQGHPIAQNSLGRLYAEGLGVPHSSAEAVIWFRKSADQGYAGGEYNLGRAYDLGEGVDQDDKQAVFWYAKASQQGRASAQSNLAHLYQYGLGTEQDYVAAFHLYQKAAAQNNAIAQYRLGLAYKLGLGTPPDYKAAVMWLKKAAGNGHPSPASALDPGLVKVNRNIFQLNNAAMRGDNQAQYLLGYAYELGNGVVKDRGQAIKWFQMAVENNHAIAMNDLALIHLEENSSVGNSKAYELLKRAIAENDANAMYNLARLYWSGIGVVQDKFRALGYFLVAAHRGVASAQYALGNAFADGDSVGKDVATAIKYYSRAADQGHARAQYNLAELYLDGPIRAADNRKTIVFLWQKAAVQGHANAQCRLAESYYKGSLGLLVNYTLAYMWWAAAGLDRTKSDTAMFVELIGKMSNEQLDQGQELAELWCPQFTTGPIEAMNATGALPRQDVFNINFYGETHNSDGLLDAYREIFLSAQKSGCTVCFIENSPSAQHHWDEAVSDFKTWSKERLLNNMEVLIADYARAAPLDRNTLTGLFKASLSALTNIRLVCVDMGLRPIRIWFLDKAARASKDYSFDAVKKVFANSDVHVIAKDSDRKLEDVQRVMEEIEKELDNEEVFKEKFSEELQQRMLDDYRTAASIQALTDGSVLCIFGRAHIDPLRNSSLFNILLRSGRFKIGAYAILEGEILARPGPINGKAGQPNMAAHAISKGVVPKDMMNILDAACNGDPHSQYKIAEFHMNNIPRNEFEAYWWFEKAAQQGYADAQYYLACIYYNPPLTWQDYDKAFYWALKAAEQRHILAQNLAGQMYYKGNGTEKNDAKSHDWYLKAAREGDAPSQSIVGYNYLMGCGVEKDPFKAYIWCSRAAAKGHEGGIGNLPWVEKQLTQDQIAQAKKHLNDNTI